MSDDGGTPSLKSDSAVKKELTDFNEIYKTQPPDSVIIDGKKENLNLDLTNASRQVWLVKLPRFLAEKWNNIDDISGREIGKLRMKKNSNDLKFKLILNHVMVDGDKEGSEGSDDSADNTKVKEEGKSLVKKEKIKTEDSLKFEQVKMEDIGTSNSMIPDEKSAEQKVDYFQGLPHSYDLRVTNKAVKNQYIFSEQNLDNYGRKRKRDADDIADAKNGKNVKGKKMSRQKFWQQQQKLGPMRFVPFVRSIPKKAALVGTVCHECLVTPCTYDQNYANVLQTRKERVSKRPDKPTIQVLKENSGIIQRFSAPSLKGDDDTFIKANKDNKNKEGRAIRMERKELLDLLFKLFDEFDYWSMKGLKERVKQPESWLKESLDSIAILIKRGPYASKYCLKPEYKKLKDVERAAKLKALGLDPVPTEEEKDEDEDEDVEMENVA